MNEERKPKEYDAVLGGNNPPPVDGLVLGGIEGVKRCFCKANSDEEKISLLKEALKYSEAGEDWLFEIASTETNKIQWIAAALISATSNEEYKQRLVGYFAKVIRENIIQENIEEWKQWEQHIDRWNQWKQHIPEIKLYLQEINLSSFQELYSIDLSKADLTNANLSAIRGYHINLAEANLTNCNLEGARIGNGNFIGTNFTNANLKNADLREGNYNKTIFINADFEETLFDKSNIINSNFAEATLVNSHIRDANIKQSIFIKANLTNTDFSGSKLEKANFYSAIFEQTSLRYTSIKNSSFNKVTSRARSSEAVTRGNLA